MRILFFLLLISVQSFGQLIANNSLMEVKYSTAQLILDRISASGGGAWWDATDISTLFQNTAGTTPVTAAGQTVRCIKDKSGNGWHLTNTVGELYQVDAAGNGYVDMLGTSGAAWTTTGATAAFKFLHDATGGSLVTMIEKYYDTSARILFRSTLANDGLELNITGIGVPQITVKGASGNLVSRINLNTTTYGVGIRRVNLYTLNSTEMNQYCDTTTPYATTTNTGTPSSNNSGQSLFIPATFKCKFYTAIAIKEVLSSANWGAIISYLNTKKGMPIPDWNTPFVTGGQSNMEASNSFVSIMELPNINVGMMDKSDRIRIANEPIHDRTNWIPTTEAGGIPNSHSSALKFAKDIYTDNTHGIKPIIVPGAVGGTSMAMWMPDTDRFDRSTLYGSVNARLVALDAVKVNIPVFVWFGHEADTGLTSEDLATGTLNTDYQQAFNDLFAEWRSDYPSSPIIFCQLSANNTATAQKRRAMEALRRCEASYGGAYAIPNSCMVVSHDLKRNASPDDVHISQEGQVELGRRIALAYRGCILGESVNWQGPRLVSITKPSSNTVLVKFTRTINDNLSNFGTLFRVYSDGSEHTVSSAVRDSGDDTAVLLTLSANHSGVVVVTYGERNTANNAVRANVVVDSDGLPAPVFGPVVAQ